MQRFKTVTGQPAC